MAPAVKETWKTIYNAFFTGAGFVLSIINLAVNFFFFKSTIKSMKDQIDSLNEDVAELKRQQKAKDDLMTDFRRTETDYKDFKAKTLNKLEEVDRRVWAPGWTFRSAVRESEPEDVTRRPCCPNCGHPDEKSADSPRK